MKEHLPEPVIEFIDDRHVKLVEPWQIRTSAGVLSIAPGFTSDGASIPLIFWNLPGFCCYEGDTLPPALAHDALYAAELVDRKVADDILYDLCRANGVCWLRAAIIWRAVRAGGGFVWRGHTPASIADARIFCKLRT